MNDRIVYKNEYIDFNVKRCVNIYNNASASGKTYLPYYVNKFDGFPLIISISTESLYNKFTNNPWFAGNDVIYFFDRFDLFNSSKLLNIFSDSTDICCLLDLKYLKPLNGYNININYIIINRKNAEFIEVKDGFLFRG